MDLRDVIKASAVILDTRELVDFTEIDHNLTMVSKFKQREDALKTALLERKGMERKKNLLTLVVNKGRSKKRKHTRTAEEKENKKKRQDFFRRNGLTLRGFVLKHSTLLMNDVPPQDFHCHAMWHNIPYSVLRPVENDLLVRLRCVEVRFLQILKDGDITDHKYGANEGYNLGLSVAPGYPHGNLEKGISGSIQWSKALKDKPALRAELGLIFRDILERAFGSDPWYCRLKAIAEKVRREEAGRVLDDMPLSAWWWTRFPKTENIHCDRNVVGATFLLTTATVKGSTFVGLNPKGKTMRHHLKAGTIMGGKWAQYAHCNSPSGEGMAAQRTTWTLYLDKNAFSKHYIVAESKGFVK